MAERALEGLRVVALGDFISAAYATKLLADLGADVVKVEPPPATASVRTGRSPAMWSTRRRARSSSS